MLLPKLLPNEERKEREKSKFDDSVWINTIIAMNGGWQIEALFFY